MEKDNLEIVRNFILRLTHSLISLLGEKIVIALLDENFPNREIIITPQHTLEFKEQNIKENLKKLISVFVTYLIRNFGYDFSEETLEKLYYDISEEHSGDPRVSQVLEFVPNGSLEKEKIKYLSKVELEKRVLERTKELQEINVNLEKLVLERTKELTKANAELEEKNKELEKLSKAKSEFVALVAHQLRTPLSAVKWGISELEEQLPPKAKIVSPEIIRILTEVGEYNKRMIQLVDDLLNLALIEEGRIIYEFKKESFKGLIKEVVNSFLPIAESSKAKLVFNPQPDEVFLMADKEKLSLAIGNIVHNAIKYSKPQGKVQIEFLIKPIQILVSIKDNGIGIPRDSQAKIFDKFFRAKNAKKKEPIGTGLGLFIARNIILAHGGKIQFESEDDKGSTFFIELPRVI